MSLVLWAPQAQADDWSFVDAAKALGFQQESDNLISAARSVCYFLGRNRDPDEIANRISRSLSVDSDMARKFFAMSVDNYCPQYQGRVSRVSD
ncbi:DUF732 domain-containing protein [Mycobacterium intracellulare]|nr:DUF732 domain-containing protein [Mycobacterium intracellulare]MDM3929485.1 DUF732 domain-containing protein [Mycobacterium intracellulare subsp. chimaera]